MFVRCGPITPWRIRLESSSNGHSLPTSISPYCRRARTQWRNISCCRLLYYPCVARKGSSPVAGRADFIRRPHSSVAGRLAPARSGLDDFRCIREWRQSGADAPDAHRDPALPHVRDHPGSLNVDDRDPLCGDALWSWRGASAGQRPRAGYANDRGHMPDELSRDVLMRAATVVADFSWRCLPISSAAIRQAGDDSPAPLQDSVAC